MTQRLLLADDDIDDCMFFKDALNELPLTAALTTARDGIDLMRMLHAGPENIPDILFLDLNMPRKTGFECLREIKGSKELKGIPVLIFSTSFDPRVVNLLHENGAHYYLRKPGEFSKLKKLIHRAIVLVAGQTNEQPLIEDFVLNVT